MLTQSPSEYLKNKSKQESTSYVINNEGEFYVCNGILIPRQEFNDLFPLGEDVRVRNEGQFKGEGIGSGKI